MTTTYHYLAISCAPESGEGIGCAGGAGFEPEDARKRFREIPGCRKTGFAQGAPTVVLDYLDEERAIVDTKFIRPAVASELLGCSEQDVYERAWRDLAQQQAEFREFMQRTDGRA